MGKTQFNSHCNANPVSFGGGCGISGRCTIRYIFSNFGHTLCTLMIGCIILIKYWLQSDFWFEETIYTLVHRYSLVFHYFHRSQNHLLLNDLEGLCSRSKELVLYSFFLLFYLVHCWYRVHLNDLLTLLQ